MEKKKPAGTAIPSGLEKVWWYARDYRLPVRRNKEKVLVILEEVRL